MYIKIYYLEDDQLFMIKVLIDGYILCNLVTMVEEEFTLSFNLNFIRFLLGIVVKYDGTKGKCGKVASMKVYPRRQNREN